MDALDKSVCLRLGLNPEPPLPGSILGFAKQTLGKHPVNGLRHPSEADTNGWFVWCGDWSDGDEFFEPLHVEHMKDYLPHIIKYLDLPPGYRFLIDEAGYEDIWYDESLMNIGPG